MVSRNTGDVVQAVTASSATYATGTTAIPVDNTIPQSNEGDQYLSVTITPTDATSSLEVEVLLYASHNSAPIAVCAALFRDAGANALAAGYTALSTSGVITPAILRHVVAAGSTSATTFNVRAGGSAGTLTVNGAAGSSYLGGVMASRITVRELSA